MLSSVDKGQTSPVEAESLTRKLLDTYKCYLLDCGTEIYLWMGRSTSLAQRKAASSAAEVRFASPTFNSPKHYSIMIFFSHTQKDY